MNRLRKPSSPSNVASSSSSDVVRTSNTLKLALAQNQRAYSDLGPAQGFGYEDGGSPPRPRSGVEQYWAARALSAEVLLAARSEHHTELRRVTDEGELRRLKDAASHEARHARLERILFALVLALLFIVAFLLHQLARLSHSPPNMSRGWGTHFTIPVLSPFTSVVEHETSVIGTKTVAVGIIVVAVLAYFAFRHWMVLHRS